ncbi:MAG: membrane protein insertion efficiency factor YidD [Spirochaetaceae bacterium]|nr:membrane protein insertion efficiency factor YidD [Spirochaetaceae bacterium]
MGMRMRQMPTEWEQDVAEMYVNARQLFRPNTTVKTVLISVFLFMIAIGIATWIVHSVLMTDGIFAYLPSGVHDLYHAHPSLSIVMLYAIVSFTASLFCFKYAVIGAIKLYQHYAPEEIRRRCLFMPTCSEYAIMAVQKYGGIIGLCKSYFRLFYRCKGNIYQIDYP